MSRGAKHFGSFKSWEVALLVIHPIIQSFAILLSLYVLYLGVQRFRFLHLKHKTAFSWKRHVTLGTTALAVLMGGMVGGMTMVRLHWHGFLMTGTHGKVALVMVPFIIFGFASGLYMNRKKTKGRVLPFLHGLNNLIVSILALMQVATGWGVYVAFVLGE